MKVYEIIDILSQCKKSADVMINFENSMLLIKVNSVEKSFSGNDDAVILLPGTKTEVGSLPENYDDVDGDYEDDKGDNFALLGLIIILELVILWHVV